MKPALAIVAPEPTPEAVLREAVPSLIEAEKAVARLRQIVAEQGRALAKERGVTFLREEALRREFGA